MRSVRVGTPQRLLTAGLLASVLAMVAGAARRVDQAALAREILADRSLHDVHEMARKVFEDGLTAGSGYSEVWIRDLNTFIEVALEVTEPQRLRESLLTFFKFQGANGDIADGYVPRDRAKDYYQYRSSLLAPTVLAHKNTAETDQESSLVQAVHKYISVTGDRAMLDEVIAGRPVRDRLGQALDYVLKERFDSAHGLVWGATTADWGDVQPERPWNVELDASSHPAIDIYDNAMFAIAVEDFIQIVGEHAPDAARWRSVRDDLKRNVRKYLWDAQKRKFVPHLYLAGSPFAGDFDESAIYYHGGTAVAIEAGLLTREETADALEHMRADVRQAGAGSIGLTLFPTYPKGAFNTPGMDPYSYQNGGDWPWFGGRMIQQLVRQGFVADAYRELKPMVTRAQRADDFYEWWSRDNQPRGSGQFRGSAGVLGRAIEMLQTWAEQHKGDGTPFF
jgi:glycogen debranching enzyme